jgi:hypothetical protein
MVTGRHLPARSLLVVALTLFLLSCIFDPAERMLGLKVWLFLACWVITAFAALASNFRAGMRLGLLVYVALFITIPLVSIACYIFSNGAGPYEGFNLLKGYVLITLAPLLVLNRIDLLPRLCAVLTVLALIIVAVFAALWFIPELYDALHSFGEHTGIVLPDVRDYGSGLKMLQVYFVTSPMLAISIAYFFDRALFASTNRERAIFLTLTAVNIAGMFLAGTRNNIVVALMLPVSLWLFFAKKKVVAFALGISFLMTLSSIFTDELSVFFHPAEYSNNIKLELLYDYVRILSDPRVLMLGQGLGAYEYWGAKGASFYISELTYLEMIRNFGLPGALIMLLLLLFPIWQAFSRTRSHDQKAIAIGFGYYLAMCSFNPNLFSSMGILILAVVLSRYYLPTQYCIAGVVGARW